MDRPERRGSPDHLVMRATTICCCRPDGLRARSDRAAIRSALIAGVLWPGTARLYKTTAGVAQRRAYFMDVPSRSCVRYRPRSSQYASNMASIDSRRKCTPPRSVGFLVHRLPPHRREPFRSTPHTPHTYSIIRSLGSTFDPAQEFVDQFQDSIHGPGSWLELGFKSRRNKMRMDTGASTGCRHPGELA